MRRSQAQRLLAFLYEHPGSTSLEITHELAIVNVTGRISDIRKLPGLDVVCRKRPDGRDGYWVQAREPVQMAWTA